MKKAFYIIFAILLLCTIGCGKKDTTQPENVGELYVEAIRNMDFDLAHEYVCTRCGAISLEKYTDAWDNIISVLEITDISVTDPYITTEDETEYLNYTITLKSDLTEDLITDVKAKMTYYEDMAHIDFTYDSILEGYEEGSYVRERTLKGTRGEIFAADGTILAQNSYSDTVYISVSADLNIDATLAQLSSIIPDLKLEKLRKNYETALERSHAVVSVKAYSRGTMDEALKEQLLRIEGVGIDDSSLTPQRYYPYGEIFAHAVGYTGAPSEADLEKYGYTNKTTLVGKTGLEASYENILHSEDGYSLEFVSSSGVITKVLQRVEPISGTDIRTTLSIADQTKAHYALEKYLADDQTGAAIVMDTKEGSISALSSNPSFDSNLFAFPIPDDVYQSTFGEGTNQPLLNRATQATLAPGSTIKPFTAAAAMDNNILTMNSVFPYEIENNKWTPPGDDWIWPPISRSERTPGELNMFAAMRSSDNIYFGWAAMKIGEDRFLQYFREKLHFDEDLPFNLPVKRGNLVNEGTEMNLKLLSDMGFGVGEMLVSPLQLVTLYTCFENDCDVIQPRIVSSITHSDGITQTTIESYGREVLYEDVMSEYAKYKIVESMFEVVRRGTARPIYKEGRSVASKTGTAVVSKTREISWVVAFYTEDTDKIVIVMVDGPADEGNIKFDICNILLEEETKE